MTNDDAILEEMLKIFEEKDWCQETACIPEGAETLGQAKAVCLAAAYFLAQSNLGILTDFTEGPAWDRIRKQTSLDGPITWNDEPGRTKEDVVLAIKRARYG